MPLCVDQAFVQSLLICSGVDNRRGCGCGGSSDGRTRLDLNSTGVRQHRTASTAPRDSGVTAGVAVVRATACGGHRWSGCLCTSNCAAINALSFEIAPIPAFLSKHGLSDGLGIVRILPGRGTLRSRCKSLLCGPSSLSTDCAAIDAIQRVKLRTVNALATMSLRPGFVGTGVPGIPAAVNCRPAVANTNKGNSAMRREISKPTS